LCDVTLSVYPHWAGLKNMPGQCGYTLRVTSHKHLIHVNTLHQHSKQYNSLSMLVNVYQHVDKHLLRRLENTQFLFIWFY
jgi:hypothetical protein